MHHSSKYLKQFSLEVGHPKFAWVVVIGAAWSPRLCCFQAGRRFSCIPGGHCGFLEGLGNLQPPPLPSQRLEIVAKRFFLKNHFLFWAENQKWVLKLLASLKGNLPFSVALVCHNPPVWELLISSIRVLDYKSYENWRFAVFTIQCISTERPSFPKQRTIQCSFQCQWDCSNGNIWLLLALCPCCRHACMQCVPKYWCSTDWLWLQQAYTLTIKVCQIYLRYE